MRSATKRKTGKDPRYLEYIRSLPCCVCTLPWKEGKSGVCYSNVQQSPTEAAHVGSRGLSQKAPDRETLPLCALHHREGQFSQHSMGKLFWPHFGLDRDALIICYQARFDGEYSCVLDPMDVVGISA